MCNFSNLLIYSFKNSSDIRDAINYSRGQGTSLFELEVIKKDMISLAQEAEIENLSLEEKLGMSIQEFCESMKRENPTSNWLGHLLKLLQTAFFIYTPLSVSYTHLTLPTIRLV